MSYCNGCAIDNQDCLCRIIEKLSSEADKPAEKTKSEENRCLACYFTPCKCKEGLKNK